jgi:hypothetical protein
MFGLAFQDGTPFSGFLTRPVIAFSGSVSLMDGKALARLAP